jgi:hypothetical protein
MTMSYCISKCRGYLEESTNFKQYGDWLHFQTSNQLLLKSRDFSQMMAKVRVFALHTGSVFQWLG